MLQVSEETAVKGPYAKSVGLQGMSQCPVTHRHCISPVLVKAQLPNAKLEAVEGGLALHKLKFFTWIWRSKDFPYVLSETSWGNRKSFLRENLHYRSWQM